MNVIEDAREAKRIERESALRSVADREIAAEKAAIAKRTIEKVTGTKLPAQPKRAVDAYAEDPTASWFFDQLAVQAEERGRSSYGGPKTAFDDINAEHARNRLASVEKRAGVGSALTAGGEFFGGGNVPRDIGQSYAYGQRLVQTVSPLFTKHDLGPDQLAGALTGATHLALQVPLITTGMTAGVATADGATVTNTDPTTARLVVPIATISAQALVSYQALELSNPALGNPDGVIATDLGSAIGDAIDNQLVNGTGTSGQTLGLLNVSGLTATSYTDASPTASELLTAISQNYNSVYTARKRPPNVILMAQRRWAWLSNGLDTATNTIIPSQLADVDDETLAANDPVGILAPGLRAYVSTKIPVNTGGSSNQDTIYTAVQDDLVLWQSPTRFSFADQVGCAAGQARISVYTYLAAAPGSRYPAGVGAITGTGLVTAAGWS